jgi:hypothetical protein
MIDTTGLTGAQIDNLLLAADFLRKVNEQAVTQGALVSADVAYALECTRAEVRYAEDCARRERDEAWRARHADALDKWNSRLLAILERLSDRKAGA